MNDWRLLRDYVERNSQPAFAQLVERHTRLVYWTCLRDVRTPQLAEDATQVVFLLLARKAAKIGKGVPLTGWLFKTARFVSKDVVKQELRRRAREERAAQEMAHTESPDAGWNEMEPLLNDALMSLSAADREAVLLRYFDALSLREVATELDVTEEAVRKRITRAVDKLRVFMSKRGVGVSASVFTALLADRAAEAAPVSCKAALAQSIPLAVSGGGKGIVLNSHLSHLFEGVLGTMAKTKMTAIAASVLGCIALGGTFVLVAHANQSQPAPAAQPTAANIGQPPTAVVNAPRVSNANTSTFADNTTEAQKTRLGGAAADPKITAEQEISAILRVMTDAANRRDLTVVEKYTTPEFQMIIPNKVTLSRNQVVQFSAANLAAMSTYLKSMSLQSFSLKDGEADVTGVIHEVANIAADTPTVKKGSVIIADTTFTEYWTKKSGQWLATRTIVLHANVTLNGKPAPGSF